MGKKRDKMQSKPWEYHWSITTSHVHNGLEFRVWRTRGHRDLYEHEHLDVDGEWHITMPDATIPAADVMTGKVASYVQIGKGTEETRNVLGFPYLKKSATEDQLRSKYNAAQAVTEAMMLQMREREWETVMADMLKKQRRRP